jgi:hypothetical protein
MKRHITAWKKVLYNIPRELGIPMKLVRVIKMCLNEIYSKVHVGKKNYAFPIQESLKWEDALSPLLLNFSSEYAIRKVQEYERGLYISSWSILMMIIYWVKT